MNEEAEVEARVTALIEPTVAGLGCTLLEVLYRFEGRWVLRLIIDREVGVTLDDCAAVSAVVGPVLEVEDPIPTGFALEVSSPGVYRPLRKPAHYTQSAGKVAKFFLAPGYLAERRSRELRGEILGVEAETVLVAADGETVRLPLAGVRSARLDPDL